MRRFYHTLLLSTSICAIVCAPGHARRQLIPDLPSIEVNLDVLQALEYRGQSAVSSPGLPFAVGASPAVRQPGASSSAQIGQQKRRPPANEPFAARASQAGQSAAPQMPPASQPIPAVPHRLPPRLDLPENSISRSEEATQPQRRRPVATAHMLPPPPRPSAVPVPPARTAAAPASAPERAEPPMREVQKSTEIQAIAQASITKPLPAPSSKPERKTPVKAATPSAKKPIVPPAEPALPEPDMSAIKFSDFPEFAQDDPVQRQEVLSPLSPFDDSPVEPLASNASGDDMPYLPDNNFGKAKPLSPDFRNAGPLDVAKVPEQTTAMVAEMPELSPPALPDIAKLHNMPPDQATPGAPSSRTNGLPSLNSLTGEPDIELPPLPEPQTAVPSASPQPVKAKGLPPTPNFDNVPASLPPTLPPMPQQEMPLAMPELPPLPELSSPQSAPQQMASLPPVPTPQMPDVSQPVAAPAEKAEKADIRSRLEITFSETENELPVSAQQQLSQLADQLKASGQKATIRPFVAGNGDSNVSDVIGTRRAFSVRTFLIDKGVSHYNITIDRNQKTAAGSPERVEVLVE